MVPNKESISRAEKDGIIDKTNLIFSASIVLSQISDWLLCEADDMMSPYGLKIGEVKKLMTDAMKSRDRLGKSFAEILADSHAEKVNEHNYQRYLLKVCDAIEIGNIARELLDGVPQFKDRTPAIDMEVGTSARCSFTTKQQLVDALDDIARRDHVRRMELINSVLASFVNADKRREMVEALKAEKS